MSDHEFSSEADDEGGMRKSFWEHLQDLRSALIRSVIAIFAALVVCLLLSPQIVSLLQYPLKRMHMFEKDHPTITLQYGDKKLDPFPATREQFPDLPPGKAPHALYHVGTMKIGDKLVQTWTLDPKPDAAATGNDIRLINLSPAEAFMTAFHVGLYAALVVSAPFWVFFMGGFILPALKTKEKSAIGQWLFWGTFLALTGVFLTYFLLLPVALRASVKYSELLGFGSSDWRADEYIDFVCKFILGMGIGFQFPIVVLLLVKMGLVTHKDLSKYRRHVVVVSLVLGAILTTPEVFTQVAMAVPLYFLYEICIWIAWYWDWKKRRRGEIVEI